MTNATHRRRRAIRAYRMAFDTNHRAAVRSYRWERRLTEASPARFARMAKWAAHKAARWTQDAA